MGIPTLSSEQRKGACGFLPIPSKGMGARRTRSMAKTLINPPALAHPSGFNHGILVTGGRLLFLSGQTASDAEGQIVAPGDLVAQYEQVLRNLQAVVQAARVTKQDT